MVTIMAMFLRSRSPLHFVAACTVICILAAPVHAVHFYLKQGTQRCFTEDLPMGQLTSVEVKVTSGKGVMELDVWAMLPNGHVLYHNRAPDHGVFSFEVPYTPKRHYSGIDDDVDYDDYVGHDEETIRFCIEHREPPRHDASDIPRRLVSFRILGTPNAANNNDNKNSPKYATEDHAKQLQESLRRAQESLASIVSDLAVLQQRERALMNRIQSTNSRVTTYAAISILIAAITTLFQTQHFRAYFKRKRLC